MNSSGWRALCAMLAKISQRFNLFLNHRRRFGFQFMIAKLFLGLPAALFVSSTLVAESTKPKMKAVVVHEYGGPEVLKYEDAPRPERKEDEILVRVIAAGVNPVDGMIRAGMFAKNSKNAFPMVPGYDIAGIVEETGAKIDKYKTGHAVYAYIGLNKGGGYAEYAVATDKEVSPKPESLSFEEAAAVPLVAETAWQALFDVAKLSAGQTVLIHGGSGGVGTFAIQIAKARGAKKVKVIVSQAFPLSDAVKAQEQAATGHTRGKIVLKVAEAPK